MQSVYCNSTGALRSSLIFCKGWLRLLSRVDDNMQGRQRLAGLYLLRLLQGAKGSPHARKLHRVGCSYWLLSPALDDGEVVPLEVVHWIQEGAECLALGCITHWTCNVVQSSRPTIPPASAEQTLQLLTLCTLCLPSAIAYDQLFCDQQLTSRQAHHQRLLSVWQPGARAGTSCPVCAGRLEPLPEHQGILPTKVSQRHAYKLCKMFATLKVFLFRSGRPAVVSHAR